MRTIVRNFICDVTGRACEDGRCKVGYCSLEREIGSSGRSPSEELVRVSKSQRPLIKEAVRYAEEILKRRQLRRTKTRVKKLIEHPTVLSEAQRRLDFLETVLDKMTIDDLFPTGRNLLGAAATAAR
jgi:hypothetical protein